MVALAVWAVLLAAYLWTTFLRKRPVPAVAGPSRRAGPVYALSVLGMVALIVLGAFVLRRAGMPQLQVGVVVTAVGLHFLPLARAFRARVFGLLGLVLLVLGALGLLLGWWWGAPVTAGLAVGAGVAMLGMLVAHAWTGGLRPSG